MDIIADEGQLHHPSPDVQKKFTIIERKEEFPGRVRTLIDEAKEENLSPADFLSRIESKLVDWLLENWKAVHIDESKGLNCDRDTEKEVELAIRFFPNVLSMKRNGRYLIFWQLRSRNGVINLKAMPFIPLLAKLAIELNQFTEEERGGLTDVDGYSSSNNVFVGLANMCYVFARKSDDEKEKHHQLVEEACLTVMKRLRENGLFKKEDILEYDLMWLLCRQPIFPEQRFRYLANWDPSCLMLPIERGRLPIRLATWYCKDIRGFRTVFELGIHHFPKETGGLFHKDRRGRTTYQKACKKFGNNEVEKILGDGFRIRRNTSTSSMLNSLVYAATEETVHLEGVFEIILQLDPTMLFQA